MASCGSVAQSFHRSLLPVGCVFLVLGYLSVASPTHGARRLICWQAIMNCQTEPECHYAYGQYVHACGSVLNGLRKCPSHCIASLVQLNLTKNGPALEECSCAQDPICVNTKRSIEPCLPRTRHTGCTEARRQCERDQQCRDEMREYLIHCMKLFSGTVCTNACRNVIANLRKIPKALLLDTCVCDGTERSICEFVKRSMQTLCLDAPDVPTEDGSGTGGFVIDDEDYRVVPQYVKRNEKATSAALRLTGRGGAVTLTLLPSIWALLPLL